MPKDREIRFSHSVLPARPLIEEDSAGVSMGPVTRKILRAESALQQRVEFEALVSRISSMFVCLRSEDLDWGIIESLRQIGEFVGVDHAHAFSVSEGHQLAHTHEWCADQTPTRMREIQNQDIDEVFPWVAQRLRRLDGIAIYSVNALAADAWRDQKVFQQLGIKSLVFLPMAVGGQLVGFLGFDSTRSELQWTEDAISLLKIVGAIIADALERKRTEDALRREANFTSALLNGSGALFIVLNREGIVIRANPAVEQLTGIPFQELQGRSFWEALSPADEAADARKAIEQLVTGAPPGNSEGSLLTTDGERCVISWSNTALGGEDGLVQYVIMSGIDITEMKRLEAEVLDVAEREQSRFGHDLHDGLGQHLTGIEFMAQVLQQQLASASRPEAHQAEEITTLIRQAISQTRDLARGLSPVVLQSKGLVVALQELAESVARRHQITCECVAESVEYLPAGESATHLYRIAQEAVANALKHGKASHIAICFREENGKLSLSIADNGQAFDATARNNKGMGLRVMNYRAGIIGGSLEISSELGRGVTIICRC